MKKALRLFTVLSIVFCLIVGMFPARAYAAPTATSPEASASKGEENGFWYMLENGQATILWYEGKGGPVVIPDKIAGKPVTAIEPRAFWDQKNITGITIGPNMVSIGDEAFFGLPSLKYFRVSAKNKAYTADSAGVLYNHDKTVLIQYPAASSKVKYTVPGGVRAISDYAFYNTAGQSKLAEVVLPDTLRSIGEEAFRQCPLATVRIPTRVEAIGSRAFYDCSRLRSIEVDGGNTHYSDADGVLMDKAQKTLIQFPAARPAGDYSMPDTVTRLENYSFYGCRQIGTLKIPASLKSIGTSAFAACGVRAFEVSAASQYLSGKGGVLFDKSQTRLIRYPTGSVAAYAIPDTVKTIAAYAFAGCALTGVDIPESVTFIGAYAFESCSRLNGVRIPDSVKETGESCFANSGIKNAVIGKGLSNLPWMLFFGCKNLTAIVIPPNIQYFDARVFENCINLKSAVIPYQVLSVYDDNFTNCGKLTISGYRHSAAEECAKHASIPFKVLGDTPRVQISASAKQSTWGTVWESGKRFSSGKYYYGDYCTLAAAPNRGYRFVAWTENSKQVSTDSVYSVCVTGAHTFTAVFTKK